jgi:two-component system sensor histidine kinase UhpB
LACEIHDQVGGSLSILKLDVASVHKRLKDDQPTHDKMNDILEEIDGAILLVQRIATERRPSLLDHVGLAAAIESHLDTHCDAHCRQVVLDCETDMDSKGNVQGACATAMFRVFQEAFTNIIRHAQATKMTVQLKQDETNVILSVTDNGVGIKQAQMLNPDALGLLGMRERMRRFGGTVTVIGRPGEGTTVTIVVPIRSASLILIEKSATTLLPEHPDPA